MPFRVRKPASSISCGGLSIGAFLTFFISRPLQALEENLQFITWLGIIYNSYWAHLTFASDAETFQAELEDATNDAIENIQTISVVASRFGRDEVHY